MTIAVCVRVEKTHWRGSIDTYPQTFSPPTPSSSSPPLLQSDFHSTSSSFPFLFFFAISITLRSLYADQQLQFVPPEISPFHDTHTQLFFLPLLSVHLFKHFDTIPPPSTFGIITPSPSSSPLPEGGKSKSDGGGGGHVADENELTPYVLYRFTPQINTHVHSSSIARTHTRNAWGGANVPSQAPRKIVTPKSHFSSRG